jgi:hypothetical protein
VGVGLWIGLLRKPAALLSLGMFVIFCGVTIYLWVMGLDPDCGCFGKNFHFTSHVPHLLLNLLFLSVSGWIYHRDK